jgi:hypothetical protein
MNYAECGERHIVAARIQTHAVAHKFETTSSMRCNQIGKMLDIGLFEIPAVDQRAKELDQSGVILNAGDGQSRNSKPCTDQLGTYCKQMT